MKRTVKLLGITSAAIGIGLLFSTTAQAAQGRGAVASPTPRGNYGAVARGTSGSFGGYSGGYHGSAGGYYGGYKGGYSGGYYGGYNYKSCGNYYGGYCYPRYSSCGSWWYPWSFSFSYLSAPAATYYPAPAYYSTPVVYSAPTVVYSAPTTTPATPAPQAAPAAPPSNQVPPMAPADVVALVKAGISDEVILSQIRNSHTVYHLTTAEIIELKNNNVSEKVIDFMINTASR